jgi:hypothetical protein
MSEASQQRLAFLLETVALEAGHLAATDARLFAEAFTPERAAAVKSDEALSERMDAFAARFARLQDTLGDKLLPVLLQRLGEPVSSVLDNLDRAARLGLLAVPSEQWIAARALRNRMVHEYIRRPELLAEALNEAHRAVPMLLDLMTACREYVQARNLV